MFACYRIVGVCVIALSGLSAQAQLVASYEPFETQLTILANTGDSGLSVSRVPAGVNGAPAATNGGYVLRLDIVNEADGKVELRHEWSAPAYDLANYDALLLDVYVADGGALPGLIGIFDVLWSPPDAWQPATGSPAVGAWRTVSFDVSAREQTGLNQIFALVFENLAGTSGTLFLDNLRLQGAGGAVAAPSGIAANGYETHNAVTWRPVALADGYHVYGAESSSGPFERLTTDPVAQPPFNTPGDPDRQRLHYYVTTVRGGAESGPSQSVSARWNGFTDEQMLDIVQQTTLKYFVDNAHPVSGMAREGIGLGHPPDTVTTGGTGMGLMALCVGVHRGFIERADAAAQVQKVLTFLEETTPRFRGAWAHHYHGVTGAVIPFSPQDDGADLVETAFLVQGFLTVRQYFEDANDPVEQDIRARATRLWEGVEWTWFRRFPGSDTLYWHWSPNFGWALNLPIRGYNETQVIYQLAIASPTFPMPASSYPNGWAANSTYTNGGLYYGETIDVGPAFGGPLFFTHYSNLGFDPRYKRDGYTNYFENAQAISRVHRLHAINNPNGFDGYNAFSWGLTASTNPWGYLAHSPTNDNGTIAPTAALSAMPYTPEASKAALRHFFDNYPLLFSGEGFFDAFNPTVGWYATGWLAIDQGPIVVMIENYRSGLIWELFMSNPEIKPMMQAIGMFYEVDFDQSGAVDAADLDVFAACQAGPQASPGCSAPTGADADLDNDDDADMHDIAVMQQLAG